MGNTERDPRARRDAEATWKLYLKKGERKLAEVFNLAINTEIKPEFQKKAIRTLLESGATSFNDWNQVWDGRLYEREAEKSNIYWTRQLDMPQAQYVAEILPSYLKKTSQGEHKNHFKFPKYISILLDLLPRLSQEQAQKLFGHFDYDFQTEQSLAALFARDHSYDMWKEKAIEETHKRTIQKRAKKDRFYGEIIYGERNFDYGYFSRLGSSTGLVFPGNGKPDQNRIDFFVKEVVWAMDVYGPEKRIIYSEGDFMIILDRLPEALRLNFIKGHIYMFSTHSIVEKLAEMFPEDIEIATHLEKLRADEEKEKRNVPANLISGIESELKYRVQKDKEKAEEKRIMDSMRKEKPQ